MINPNNVTKVAAIKNRYDFMLLVEAAMCNPNGDPDMDNNPRKLANSGLGMITSVAIKSRIRKYVMDAFDDINNLIVPATNINRAIAESYVDVTGKQDLKGVGKGAFKQEVGALMCQKYWDVRTFGGVLSVGRNAGQIQGPVQIDMSTSVDPITIQDLTITRTCYTADDFDTLLKYDEADAKKPDNEKRTMGDQKITPYGLYVVKGSISASLAERTGFSEDDLSKLWEALLQMYNHDISTSKKGMNVVSPLIIFKHVGTQNADNESQNAREAKLGCAPAQMLYKLLSIEKKDGVDVPTKTDDYDITFNASGIPNGVEAGFKYLPFEAPEWNTDNLKKCGITVM